jgi:membrane-associated phospholipid phosphatase
MSATSIAAVRGRRGAGAALLVAGMCAAGLALTWVFAELVPVTHVRDAVVLYDFTRLDRPFVEVPANVLLALFEPWFFAVWGIVLVALALSQGRSRVALAVAFVLALAPGSAELLKPLVAHPHAQVVPLYIKDASWPSGHATAATAFAWCALLVASPARRRTVAMLGVVLVVVVGCALLILAWHMPSDVLGGYLLATLWVALAVAALRVLGPSGSIETSGLSGPSGALGTSQVTVPAGPPPCAPGAHSDSDPGGPSFAARLRMNNMSDSRFR